MDTLNLRLFVRAAEMLNISLAGRSLGMAPAVASARLAKLEQAVGADLLHRSTRKVSLSSEGDAFLPYAREMLAQEEAGLAALGHGKAEVSGTVRFAAPSTFAQLYLAPALPRLLARHPGLSLDLKLTDQPQDLIVGSFDLALRSQRADDSSLKARKLAEDRRVLCAAPAYLDRAGRPTSAAELAEHSLIAFQSLSTREMTGPDGAVGLYDPRAARARLVMDDGASQRAATLAGCGISVNSLWSVAAELDSGALEHVLPGHEVDGDTALWLIYPKSNVLTAKVRVLIDFLIEEVRPKLP